MEISQIIPHVEALIFAADRPLPLLEIVDLLNNALAFLEDRTTLDQVEAAMEAIREKYSSEFYAFEVRSSGGGYQFLTKKEYYQTVAQLNGDKFLKRLSTAALETLAIIAYRQPISKGEIEYIRGVSTDYSIQKLLEKELIVITGRSEDQPGKPLLYAVSRSFMDYFGLSSVADLPKLKELFDEEMVQPTLISDETATLGRGEHSTDTAHSLMVSEDGELLDPDHKLDDLSTTTLLPTEEEHPASEDEEVEPDDEIIRFDDFIDEEKDEEKNDAPDKEEEKQPKKPTTPKPPKAQWIDPGDREPEHPVSDENDEDPDDIVEDNLSGNDIDEELIEEQAAEEDKEEDNVDNDVVDDDGDKDPDDMMEDAILGEKLLSFGDEEGEEEDDDEEEEDDDEDDDEEEESGAHPDVK
ncbi:MAG: SMC-Scp complex subunit ScpB [Chitinophaga sp.]|uniref:SMC-Scp complex subunit ScpB n=1 Tax=Chitinophaga sp. TaxID=1869181 RepID=UPI001B1BDF47|nr:SMC-Scp complex subunit ScpB [Chitinophaga sp.]MBO9729475.1 SMC-Scp complex subunit ScpB [Chitinophaga sp.]